MTADLLTIARIDSNQQMLAKETIAIAPFIQELAKPFQEIAKMNNKQFVLENLATTTAVFDPKNTSSISNFIG